MLETFTVERDISRIDVYELDTTKLAISPYVSESSLIIAVIEEIEVKLILLNWTNDDLLTIKGKSVTESEYIKPSMLAMDAEVW